MSAKASLDHRRTHNLLLISRLLSLRDAASPFTLVLDSLSQSARPLVREYIMRAQKIQNCKIVYVSFSSFTPPRGVTQLITARRKTIPQLQKEIQTALSGSPRALLILDSLNPLSSSAPLQLSPFLSSLLSPTTTLLGVYHTDIPLSLPAEGTASSYPDSAPDPITLLKYFATTLFTVHSITHLLAEKRAKDKSLPPPQFGLDEGIEGVLVGLGSNSPAGFVVEMEYRRKSGRGVGEWFYVPLQPLTNGSSGQPVQKQNPLLPGKSEEEKIILLEDHPEWRASEQVERRKEEDLEDEEEQPRSTFELGLTEAQRKKREEVVLPYFDAQRADGIGGGGKILFTPDREIDDFDEEEDEI